MIDKVYMLNIYENESEDCMCISSYVILDKSELIGKKIQLEKDFINYRIEVVEYKVVGKELIRG